MITAVLSLCLFVGIGVDDMFVIVQAWSNLSPKEHATLPISERMGLTLQHAVSGFLCYVIAFRRRENV